MRRTSCPFLSLLILAFFAIASHAQQRQSSNPNSIHATYEYIRLEGDRADWNLARFWYERDFDNLTSLIRIRYADRFNRSAYMLESDLYPEFSERSYALIGAGLSLSDTDLFPNVRMRGTLFRNVSSSLVAGIGIRYLSFDIDDVIIYKADLNLYVEDFLIMTQGFLQIRNKKPLATAILTARKYLTYPTFLFLKLGYGHAPQGLRFEEDVLNTFESIFISAGGDFKVSDRLGINVAVSYRKNIFSEFTTRNRYGVSAGLYWRF
jgi:YaiO family outer membrane protein